MIVILKWLRCEDPRVGFSRASKEGWKFKIIDRGRKTGMYFVQSGENIPWRNYGFSVEMVCDIIFNRGEF